MKRVFEGYVSSRFAPPKKGYAGGNYFNLGGYSLTKTRQCINLVRITVEDLPENKPEQPKPAEPQGWEQRFDTFWKSYADKEDVLYTWNNCQRRKDELLSFIRAEIDRAWGDGFKAGHDIAEENRSNE